MCFSGLEACRGEVACFGEEEEGEGEGEKHSERSEVASLTVLVSSRASYIADVQEILILGANATCNTG